MPMNACPGVRLASTSAPSALALTDSMNDFTTAARRRFQQCDAHLAQRLGDVLVRDPAAAAQILEGARQARRQMVEHDSGWQVSGCGL